MFESLKRRSNLFLSFLIALGFYGSFHYFFSPPIINQETGMALVLAKVKYGSPLDINDRWWQAQQTYYDFMPFLRLFLLNIYDKFFGNPDLMAFCMSIIYAGCAIFAWSKLLEVFFGKKIRTLFYAFLITLPFDLDRWTVGVSEGFRDYNFIVIFFPILMERLIATLKDKAQKNYLILGLVIGLYFNLHPTIGILVYLYIFFFLFFFSLDHKRGVLVFVISSALTILPFLIFSFTAGGGETNEISEKYYAISKQFYTLFPHNKFMNTIIFLRDYVDMFSANWLAFFSSFVFLFSAILLYKKNKLYSLLLLNIIINCFAGNFKLILLSSLGYLLFFHNNNKVNWLRKWLLIPSFLYFINSGFEGTQYLVEKITSRHLYDGFWLIKILFIPFNLLGICFLINPLVENIKNERCKYLALICSFVFIYTWNFFGTRISISLIYEFFLTLSAYYFIKNVTVNPNLRLSAITLLTIFYIYFGVSRINTPFEYYFQNQLLQKTLTNEVRKEVHENDLILTGPYFLKLRAQRPIYFVSKDLNIYLTGRYTEQLELWTKFNSDLNLALKNTNGIEIVEIMRKTNSTHFISEIEFSNPNLKKIYGISLKIGAYYLYRLNG